MDNFHQFSPKKLDLRSGERRFLKLDNFILFLTITIFKQIGEAALPARNEAVIERVKIVY